MAATPLPQMGTTAGNPILDGTAALPPPPGTDMTGICFRDQLWLNTYPLDRNLVFDYFALSPFYDWTCNNEQLRSRSIHPLDVSHLSKMTGIEYVLSEVLEPHLFVIKKLKRDSPDKTTAVLTYYILDGSVYQAPQLCNVFAARIGRSIYHLSKAFNLAASKLEKIGYADSESEGSGTDTKVVKDTINIKELKRVDHILASLLRKSDFPRQHSLKKFLQRSCLLHLRRLLILRAMHHLLLKQRRAPKINKVQKHSFLLWILLSTKGRQKGRNFIDLELAI